MSYLLDRTLAIVAAVVLLTSFIFSAPSLQPFPFLAVAQEGDGDEESVSDENEGDTSEGSTSTDEEGSATTTTSEDEDEDENTGDDNNIVQAPQTLPSESQQQVLPGEEIECEDGVDNDGDGAIDSTDSDCVSEIPQQGLQQPPPPAAGQIVPPTLNNDPTLPLTEGGNTTANATGQNNRTGLFASNGSLPRTDVQAPTIPANVSSELGNLLKISTLEGERRNAGYLCALTCAGVGVLGQGGCALGLGALSCGPAAPVCAAPAAVSPCAPVGPAVTVTCNFIFCEDDEPAGAVDPTEVSPPELPPGVDPRLPPICDEGQVFNTVLGECEGPDTCEVPYEYNLATQQCELPTCEEGFEYNAATGECEPPITCNEGFEYSGATGRCEPTTPPCIDGYEYDAATGQCVGIVCDPNDPTCGGHSCANPLDINQGNPAWRWHEVTVTDSTTRQSHTQCEPTDWYDENPPFAPGTTNPPSYTP